MSRALLLNNWQQERRGSEEESREARKVVSPLYVDVTVKKCERSPFYLLVSLTKKLNIWTPA